MSLQMWVEETATATVSFVHKLSGKNINHVYDKQGSVSSSEGVQASLERTQTLHM